MRYIVLFLVFINLMTACQKKKDPPPKYTVKGRIMDGSTGTSYKNLEVELIATGGTGSSYQEANLGKSVTNDTGWFSITYEKTDVTGWDAQIRLFSQFFQLKGLPINKSVDKRFYLSSMGSVKLSLHTDSPLGANDTLYIGYPKQLVPDLIFHTDTILTTVNGYFKTYRIPPPYKNFYWGRSAKEYAERKKGLYVEIDGDPIVNEATINY